MSDEVREGQSGRQSRVLWLTLLVPEIVEAILGWSSGVAKDCGRRPGGSPLRRGPSTAEWSRRPGAGGCGHQEGSGVTRATISADGETITVHIPLTFKKRGGRKLVVTPNGALWAPRPQVDNAMVKALARTFRGRRLLEEGVHATLEDLAQAKGLNATYVSRVLGLTLLAPKLVEAILDGRQPAELQLKDLLEGFPLEWGEQGRHLGAAG
jgi:hypothetical protein